MKIIQFISILTIIGLVACQNAVTNEKTDNSDAKKVKADYPIKMGDYTHWNGLLYRNVEGKLKYLSIESMDAQKKLELKCIQKDLQCVFPDTTGTWFFGANYYQQNGQHFFIRHQSDGIVITQQTSGQEELSTVFFEHSAYMIQQGKLYFMDQNPCSETTQQPILEAVNETGVWVIDDYTGNPDFIYASNDYLYYNKRWFWRGCEINSQNKKDYPMERLKAAFDLKKFAHKENLKFSTIDK